MALSAGARLGAYEILAPLGAGGMGEVYKARDTRLGRIVAIKILPPQFAADPQFRERFQREAKTISQLNHPHICTLHDVGEHDGTAFLVMEYVEGETLAARIERGALKLDEALKIAILIARALDAAHRAGVVHRDLKPGNVMVTKGGAKLLDFGLAKHGAGLAGGARKAGEAHVLSGVRLQPDLSVAPTITSPITAQGTILGTFQYMAPEQLEGQEADARSDIWAFGCVLYEMVTGRKAFQGKTQVSLIGAILKDDPPLVSTVQAMNPVALDFVVRKCLAKDPDDRWQTARDLASQLEWIAQGSSENVTAAAGPHAAVRRRTRLAWLGVALVSVLGAGSLIAWRLSLPRPAEERPVRFDISMPETPVPSQITVSPDGRLVAFVARASGSRTVDVLWVRPLDSTIAQPVAGTDGARHLFWSPDSRYIGFGADGKVKRVAITGGPPQTLCDAALFSGGTWNQDGVIIFSASAVLYRVAAVGGQPVSLMNLDEVRRETNLRWPFFLPDGHHFLYSAQTSDPENRGTINIGSLDSPERTPLVAADSMAAYAHPGYVLFHREGTLMALPFDAKRRQVSGEPFRVADTISFNPGTGRAGFGVSDNGVLLYRTGVGGVGVVSSQLAWFDRTGKLLGPVGEPGQFVQIVLSPDEKRIAVERPDAKTGTRDIWVLDISSNILTRVTLDPANDTDPVWSPDGRVLAFNSNRKGKNDFYQRTLGASDDTLIFESSGNNTWAGDWSRDGRFLLYHSDNPNGSILALPMTGDRKPIRLLQAPFATDEPHFAPDGRWVAYNSDESGTTEVFVASFPSFENRKQISLRGGGAPRWRADGKELFYMSPDGKLMSVTVKSANALEFSVPTPLFQTPIRTPALNIDQYAVTGDGQRFLVLNPTEALAPVPITVVLNWTSLLKKYTAPGW